MNVAVRRAGGVARIELEGVLTMSRAGHVHQALLAALAGTSRIELALGEVVEADVSFLQLVCAAHRAAAARSIEFSVAGPGAAEPLRRLVGAAGLRRCAGCPERCVWPDAWAVADNGTVKSVDSGASR